MFVAKNDDGSVILFYSEPIYKDGRWLAADGKYFEIDSSMFPYLPTDRPIEVGLEELYTCKCKSCGTEYKYHIDDIVDCSDFERETYWHYTVCPHCNTKNNVEV